MTTFKYAYSTRCPSHLALKNVRDTKLSTMYLLSLFIYFMPLYVRRLRSVRPAAPLEGSAPGKVSFPISIKSQSNL